MAGPGQNCHGTVIRIGASGLIFVGPSGAGKSMLAFLTLTAALRRGHDAALVADDQVILEPRDGRLIAHRPAATAGLIEIRGTGIATLPSEPFTVLTNAIRPVDLASSDRLPPEDEHHLLLPGCALPLLRIDRHCADPLAVIAAFLPLARA